MGAKSPRRILAVDGEQRLTIPFELLAWLDRGEGKKGGELWLFPRDWVRRLQLSPPCHLGVWAVADLTGEYGGAGASAVEDWATSPLEVLDLADTNPEAALLARMVYRCTLGPKHKNRNRSSWHLTIPVEIREAGFMPKSGGRLWVFDEAILGVLSIWRLDAWEAYVAQATSFPD